MDDTLTSATYAKLFPEQVADRCSSDALEANNGPIAYLHALYQLALSVEANGYTESKITLAVRRPDIGERVLDQGSLDTPISALTLVIEAMTRQAKAHVGEAKDLEEEIAQAQYPVQLPFHSPLEQIKAELHGKRTSLFDLLQQCQHSFPNFTHDSLRTSELRSAMRKGTGFSPALQSLLLDASPSSGDGFLTQRFGVPGTLSEGLEALTSVELLGQKTGLKPDRILEMLATSGVPDEGKEAFTTVKQSQAYVPAAENKAPVGGHLFGAVFINNASAPALSLEDTMGGAGIRLRIKGATTDHFGRIHKIIHLQHALKLTFSDVDLLVMAALRSEGQTKDFHLTADTLRALGVFLHMRDEYGITAEQFAALINAVTPYAVDDNKPFLDRLLDSPAASQAAPIASGLMIDGTAFELLASATGDTAATNVVIAGLCRAFALEEQQANLYVAQITTALRLKKPALSLTLVSALYRLAWLPRLLRVGPIEGARLIALISNVNTQVFSQLAGTPTIGGDEVKPDILDVLMGLVNLEKWLRQHKIRATTLSNWLTQLPTVIPEELKPLYKIDGRLQSTLEGAVPRLKVSLITEPQIVQAVGPGITPASGTWLGILAAYIDERGLIKGLPAGDFKEGLAQELKGKLKNTGSSVQTEVNTTEIAEGLLQLLTNASIAQEDVVKHVVGRAFGSGGGESALTPGHALELLRWINKTGFDVLNDILTAESAAVTPNISSVEGLDFLMWTELERHAQVVRQLQLSATGLRALSDHPEWFDLKGNKKAQDKINKHRTGLSLDLCYQASQYCAWVKQCERCGMDEKVAQVFLINSSLLSKADIAKRLSALIGWSESETMLALTYADACKSQRPKTVPSKPFQDFLDSLTKSEQAQYQRSNWRDWTSFGELVSQYLWNRGPSSDKVTQSIYEKFVIFVSENPGPLKVSKDLILPKALPKVWEQITPHKAKDRELSFVEYEPETPESQTETDPTITITDIGLTVRLKNLCQLTELSCQSLLDLNALDHSSPFSAYRSSELLLVGSDKEMNEPEPHLQEQWRDALAAFLVGHWAPSSSALQQFIPSVEALSTYLLTDVLVSSAVKTHAATQATASLQHYLHNVFARLEPGYLGARIPEEQATAWRQYMGAFSSWRVWQTQLNHPANLIYYANRPDKSEAFKTLENELNQGKLDTSLLQTAITGYLTKFEKNSNLQVVSGYLDGTQPQNDTYHFIGKTNASPIEYYWRSVDMGLRDSEERLSPLAWTEWEKITVSASGQIAQSSNLPPAAVVATTTTTAPVTPASEVSLPLARTCDAIRPVMIEGRPYVFWVEWSSVELPDVAEKNRLSRFKKLSVQYIYKQSDGFWSPPNEILYLDGTKNGEAPTKGQDTFLKDDKYVPGLIAVVNTEGARADDPWLTVMLYNCARTTPNKAPSLGTLDVDYFIESRDMLLIHRMPLKSDESEALAKVLYKSYSDIRKIQHPYDGDQLLISRKKEIHTSFRDGMRPFVKEAIASPHFIKEHDKAVKYISLERESSSRNWDIRHNRDRVDLKSFRFLYMKTSKDDFTLQDNLRDLKNGTPNRRNSYFSDLEVRKGLQPDLAANLKDLNKALGSNIELCYYSENDKYGYNEYSEKYFFTTLESNGFVTATADVENQKILTIEASYPKSIIKLEGDKKLQVKAFKKEIRIGDLTYTVSGSLPETDCTINKSITIPLEISGEGLEAPHIGYVVYVADNVVYSPERPVSITPSSSGTWTYDLVVEKSQYLFEKSFSIIFLSPGNFTRETFPVEALIKPEYCGEIQLILYAQGPKDSEFKVLSDQKLNANGQASFTTQYTWSNPGVHFFILCEAGNPENNAGAAYDVRYTGKDESWEISIAESVGQAQYLDLRTAANEGITLKSNTIRLNTLFGKQLLSRAARNIERALGWEAQLIKEPAIDSESERPPVDFHGANGAYFRELFLHLPYLVATRLSEQQQFDEAEEWYTRYLFDPYGTEGDQNNSLSFWKTRPLVEVGSGRSELQKTVDPIARAFTLSRYYRQAVFLSLVDNWQRQGDHFYRQLTPSSLNHAWLSYQKALKLIGPLPERASVSRWVADALKDIQRSAFRTPINERIINARKMVEQRLFNLRHGLTIDGKILPVMDWRTEGADALGIAQRNVDHMMSTYNSDRAPVPAFRFRQLAPMARAAAQQLQNMGRYYMKLVEDESNTGLAVLLKEQEIKFSEFSVKLQQEAINSVKAQSAALQYSRQMAEYRKGYYTNLIDVGRSQMEEAATALMWTGSILQAQIAPFSVGEGIADSVPCIFGMAVGGQKYSGMISAVISLFDHASTTCSFTGEQLLTESGYERRAAEWAFEQKLAEMDTQLLDLQIKEADIELKAAVISLDMAQADRANLIEAHAYMTSGLAILPVYNWLVARQELLYAPAYDAVLSLCLSAEAAWRYEIGDYKSASFIKTSGWNDTYKGLLAGESLLVDLQEMENAYLQNKERRLTIKKTIDIKGEQNDIAWLAAIKNLATSPLTFDLKPAAFDKDYPGHYLRQLQHVSVSFVMAPGSGANLENISAILTQTDSTTLVEPTDEGLEYLYNATKAPPSIKRNLRAQQQIALSTGMADDGLGLGKDDWVYEMIFHDGRYLPFEGTGAISRWELSFPDPEFAKLLITADQKTVLVKNIQIHLVYTALDGGKAFADKVKERIAN
ncbi:Tc toxin subunit A [Pseudomonas graminis]|uniref:Virulence plasmid A protein n=1 Tax=Pseudomonas graminis TaxID=158627 RepID=A0A1C2DM98_9PSED|nr:Tc toxin subunit A [Pseudomonas graminis]OCX15882.1 hypothetical protein BBI10_19370 [Pseudomonas graminis]